MRHTFLDVTMFFNLKSLAFTFITMSMLCLSAQASDFCYGKLAYSITSISSRTVQVVNCDPTIVGALVIPDSVQYQGRYYTVTNINENALCHCPELTEIYIPKTIVNFVNRSFTYCPKLERIIVDPENPYLDSRENCNAIIRTATNTLEVGCKTTKVPRSVVRIGYGAFEGCTSLTDIEIPEGIYQISARAFEGCTGLTHVFLPRSIINIDGLGFFGCSNLKAIHLNEGLQLIKDEAFMGCCSLKDIDFPSTLKVIGHDAFRGCPGTDSLSTETKY